MSFFLPRTFYIFPIHILRWYFSLPISRYIFRYLAYLHFSFFTRSFYFSFISHHLPFLALFFTILLFFHGTLFLTIFHGTFLLYSSYFLSPTSGPHCVHLLDPCEPNIEISPKFKLMWYSCESCQSSSHLIAFLPFYTFSYFIVFIIISCFA